METKEEIVGELKKAWEGELKPLIEQINEEKKARGEITAETKQLEARIDKEMDAIEARFQKIVSEERANQEKGKVSPERKAALDGFLRKGVPDPAAIERKDLIIGDDTLGGVLVPTDLSGELLKGIVEYSPVRTVARVTPTVRQSLKIRKRTGSLTAAWVGETQTKTESNPTFGVEEIPTHELAAIVDVSNWELEDSDFDIQGELSIECDEQFGAAEGAAFTSGNGVKKPEGFLANATLIANATQTATNDTFVANDLISLYFAPKTGYAKRAAWLMNRQILKVVRKFQDQQGNYLWQPGLAGLAPATILDRPYVEMPDMANAVADQAIVAAFGDFYTGYRIADRKSLTVLRDPYTQAANGMVRFVMRKRVGGQVVVPEAISLLKVQ
jgi:HK97 family phage major capsid protein